MRRYSLVAEDGATPSSILPHEGGGDAAERSAANSRAKHSSAKRSRQGEDHKPDQPANQRAVDADILQVLADLQFEAIDEGGGVPIVDHRGDIAADFGPARQNGAQCEQSEPPVNDRPAPGILFEPPAERGMTCEVESWFRGYAILAVARRNA